MSKPLPMPIHVGMLATAITAHDGHRFIIWEVVPPARGIVDFDTFNFIVGFAHNFILRLAPPSKGHGPFCFGVTSRHSGGALLTSVDSCTVWVTSDSKSLSYGLPL